MDLLTPGGAYYLLTAKENQANEDMQTEYYYKT